MTEGRQVLIVCFREFRALRQLATCLRPLVLLCVGSCPTDADNLSAAEHQLVPFLRPPFGKRAINDCSYV